MARRPVKRRRDGTFEVALGANEREVLTEVVGQFRALLVHETPSSDPSLQRLFPPAHPDDPIAELEYEDAVGDELLQGRLASLDVLERTARAKTILEPDVLACMRAINDVRLVLGTRLDIREDASPQDVSGDPDREATFELYTYLSWLLGMLIEEIGEPA
ncbi:MAG TPA: DUF2017 family protein [Actinomycetota bacterium]|nr:DUF2017 family protein [Actinomycetota bacterium]